MSITHIISTLRLIYYPHRLTMILVHVKSTVWTRAYIVITWQSCWYYCHYSKSDWHWWYCSPVSLIVNLRFLNNGLTTTVKNAIPPIQWIITGIFSWKPLTLHAKDLQFSILHEEIFLTGVCTEIFVCQGFCSYTRPYVVFV